jgi:T-complex protein 1 subunit delta
LIHILEWLLSSVSHVGIHPTIISEAFQRAAAAAVQILHEMSHPILLSDRATLLQAASTSLSSKIVSQHSGLLAPMAVDAILKTIDPKTAENVDLKNIRIVKKVGGTIDDSEMVNGLVLTQGVLKSGGGPARMEKARIGLIQFQLSPPKPDVILRFQLLSSQTNYSTRWRIKLSSTTTDRWIKS